jgi:hypothetical protein
MYVFLFKLLRVTIKWGVQINLLFCANYFKEDIYCEFPVFLLSK